MKFIVFLSKGVGLLYLFIFLIALLFLVFVLTLRSRLRSFAGRILMPSFFIVLSLFIYTMTFAFPRREEVGPALVPRLWSIIMIPLNVYLLVNVLRGKEEPDPPWGKVGQVAIFTFLLFLYIYSMKYIGFYISSFLFLFIGMYILGYRRYVIMVIISVSWLLFSYFAFYKMLYVPLPAGIWIEALLGG